MSKRFLDFRFDVSDLTEDEAAYLTGEVMAQAERSEGHPSVEVEYENVELDIGSTFLVHLNVTAPEGNGRTAEQIATAISGALEVGSDDESLDGLTVDVVLAEEI